MSVAVAEAATAEDEWVICSACRAMVYGKRFLRTAKVCPECGHHHRLTARERVDHLLDAGSAEFPEFAATSVDVLGFVDTRPYPQRLEQARRATGLAEGVVVAHGRIGGRPLVVAAMDFAFLGGSLGAAAGELITLAAEEALRRRVPLLIASASGGARMQEGSLSLMQMAKTSVALAGLDEAGLLTVSLITDPTYGGVAASFATQCAVIVAEPAARLGFAGPRVIEQTIGHALPPGFQTAEFLLKRGFVDMIRPRSALRDTLRRLLAVAGDAPPEDAPPPPGALVRDPAELPDVDPWRAVQQARDIRRPTTLDYVDRVLHDFEELHGDRVGGDSAALVTGVGMLGTRPVAVLGQQRGRTAGEMTERGYGMPGPAGYRKAARLMGLAARLGLPVVALVDTPGAHPGIEAEENGQAQAIADCLKLMASLPVPMITVIIGEGGSGGALALGLANEVLITAGGVYSVISPEGCASILWSDAAMAPRAAEALHLDSRSLLRMSIVDGVIREPEGGVAGDHQEAARRLGEVLRARLHELARLTPDELVRARRARFRSFGAAPVGERPGSGR